MAEHYSGEVEISLWTGLEYVRQQMPYVLLSSQASLVDTGIHVYLEGFVFLFVYFRAPQFGHRTWTRNREINHCVLLLAYGQGLEMHQANAIQNGHCTRHTAGGKLLKNYSTFPDVSLVSEKVFFFFFKNTVAATELL